MLRGGRLLPLTQSVVGWSFILIFFKFFVDMTFHFENLLKPINELLKQILTVLMLPIFEEINYQKNTIEKMIWFSAAIPLLMGFCQTFNPAVIWENILHIPLIGFAGGQNFTEEYLTRTNRIVGTHNIAIGFSLLTGYLFILSYVYYLQNKKQIWHLVLMTFLFFLMMKTQTRSAIYGIFPSIFYLILLSKK